MFKKVSFFISITLLFSSCSTPIQRNTPSVTNEATYKGTPDKEKMYRDLLQGSGEKKTVFPADAGKGPTILEKKNLTDLPLKAARKKIPSQVRDQMALLRKGRGFFKQNDHIRALELAKGLERSKNRQIQARAGLLKGEVLFKQEQYDLAMQIFEDLIGRYAFSGVVLSALKHLVICTEKLNLTKKNKQYDSMLRDIFEAI